MKPTTLCIIMILVFHTGFGQFTPGHPDWKGGNFSWYTRSKTDKEASLVTASFSSYDYAALLPEHPAFDSLEKDPAQWGRRPNHLYWATIFDSTLAGFFIDGIAPENLSHYEFRVLVNGQKPIQPWSPVPDNSIALSGTAGDKGPKMYLLGQYTAPCGDYLLVDLRKIGSDSILSTAAVLFPSIHPTITNVYTPDQLDLFFKRLSHPNTSRDTSAPIPPATLQFKPADNNLAFYLKGNITRKEELEYQLIRDGKTYIDWRANDFDNSFIWLRNLPPGDYQLKMRFTAQRQHITTCPFRIATAWHQTALFKIIIGSLLASFFACIGLLLRIRRQRRTMTLEQQKKESVETELRTLRTQLNPHFIFNSLNSIQGLINRNDMDRANEYLTNFATLMRDVLNFSAHDRNHLHQEIRILANYLRLEQLRFDFTYTMESAPDINPFEVEVPALLIQPLVENSVKHAMSLLPGSGHIDIRFTRQGNHLVASIEDNGKGFDQRQKTAGYGLLLTRRRITLINQLSAERSIQMEINSTGRTLIRLIYTNWLA